MSRGIIIFLALLSIQCGVAHAQAYRYMDSSGNIHFTDDLARIPKRYINQVIPPTPAPKLTEADVLAMRRQQANAERERAFKIRDQKRTEKLRREMVERKLKQLRAEEYKAREDMRLQRMN